MKYLHHSIEAPRLKGVTQEQLDELLTGGFGNRGTPFIVTDAMDEWSCMKWSFESLRARYGDQKVVTYNALEPNACMEGLFSDYVDYMLDSRGACGRLPAGFRYINVATGEEIPPPAEVPQTPQYLCAWNLDSVKELAEGFPQPYFMQGRNLLDRFPPEVERLLFGKHTWIFIGPAGTLSQLHNDHDHVHTYIAQVLGKKHFILYSPYEAHFVAEMDPHGITRTGLTADPLHPDLEAFPQFYEAHPYEATIGPGDLLFLPSGWLHFALGIEAGVTVSRDSVDPINFGRWFQSMAIDRLPKLMRRVVQHDAILASGRAPLWSTRLRKHPEELSWFLETFCQED